MKNAREFWIADPTVYSHNGSDDLVCCDSPKKIQGCGLNPLLIHVIEKLPIPPSVEEAAKKYAEPYVCQNAGGKSEQYCSHDVICAFKAGAQFALSSQIKPEEIFERVLERLNGDAPVPYMALRKSTMRLCSAWLESKRESILGDKKMSCIHGEKGLICARCELLEYNPEAIHQDLKELFQDRKRLEWMIESECYVSKCFDGTFGVFRQEHNLTETLSVGHKTSHDAIDAAMNQEKGDKVK